MLNTFIITLREGVEIAVVLAIILAYLHQLGATRSAGKVWLGTAAAAIVSVGAAVGIFAVLHTTEVERFQAPLEGGLKLLAVIILTWMTLWMKRESGAIGSSLRQRVLHAVSDGSVWTLASLAFISVIREGIETVLFVVGSTHQLQPSVAPSWASPSPQFLVESCTGGAGIWLSSRSSLSRVSSSSSWPPALWSVVLVSSRALGCSRQESPLSGPRGLC
jgi:FTR1 family protein